MGANSNGVLYEVEECSQMDEITDDEENAEHQVHTTCMPTLTLKTLCT